MPARNFAALIERLCPDRSVREITEKAGLAENKISYYLKPSTTVTRIPPATTISEIARALGCDPVEVVQAFAADVELPWGDNVLTEDDRDLLRVYHRLTARDRRTLRLMAMVLLNAHDENAEQMAAEVNHEAATATSHAALLSVQADAAAAARARDGKSPAR